MATKSRNNWLFIIWLFLFSFGVSGLLFVLLHGSQYMGKDYFGTDTFRSQLDEFTSLLGFFEAEPSMKEDVKEAITISDEDIEEYRYRYGDLNEQLANIKAQYEDTINHLQAENNKEAAKLYIAERDKKLKDITQNFASDDYVKAKIIKERQQKIDDYFQDIEKNYRGTYNEYRKLFIYDLKDLNSSKEYSNSKDALDKKKMKFIRSYPFKGEYLYAEGISPNDYYEYEDIIEQLNYIKGTELQGTIAIAKTAFAGSHPLIVQYHEHQAKQKMIYIYGLLSLLALFISLYLYKKGKIGQPIVDEGWVAVYHRIPIDIRAGLLMVTAICLLLQLDVFMNQLLNYNLTDINLIGNCILYILFISILMGLVLLQAKDFVQVIRSNVQAEWGKSLIYRAIKGLQQFFLNRSIGWQMIMLLTIIFFAGLGLAGVILEPALILIYFPLLVVIVIPVVFYLVKQIGRFNAIIATTDEWARGNFESELATRGKSVLARLARNLNELKYGVKTSEKVAVKSERLKTELITNVSHDLRTPLTSIITYTELLKTPDLTKDDREAYIEIIDRKSKRLKVLIDDLFEVSKMASGNMDLVKERADIVQLLQQSLAEYDEAIRESSLQFRISNLEKPIFAVVDGQKIWRVFDNLIGNILKYSLEHTRVYISVSDSPQQVVISFKNVTKYELSENIDELFERFKRGDTSRHTEGSGLGLAIAKSIMDLHEGQLDMEVDGDLFKVTIILKK